MKNLLKRIPKKAYFGVATLAIIAGVATQAMAGFGPDRPTRAWTAAENGFDYVTFNSFTGVPNGIGDEREFFRGVQVGRDGSWSDPVNSVERDAEVEMKIYIHNNADPLLNDQPGQPGVAKNVTVKAELPTGTAKSHQAKSTISASNANPVEIFDTLDLTGANGGFFELSYVPGSAKLFDHETGSTTSIADTIVTTGVNIGDQKGCFKYVKEITFRVKVKVPSYSTQKTARLKGESSDKWRKVVNAKAGDEVEYRIWFKNAGTTDLNSVKIVDDLPPYTTVVGGVEMDKGPRTIKYGPEAVQNNGKQVNIDAGTFNPNDDAFVYITVKIDNAKELECGVNQINNTAFATPEGLGTLNDSASVNVFGREDCEQPTYICEVVNVEKLGGRKVRVSVSAPVSGGAEFKRVTVNYGDGSSAKVTDQLTDEYEYRADGTYKVTATVTFRVNGEDKQVTSEACAKMVTFVPEGKCPIPGKEHLPKDSADCKETPVVPELPKTGAAGVAGIVAMVTVAGAALHNVFTRRSVR